MKQIGKLIYAFSWIGLCLTIGVSEAHLTAGSLTPAGGQTFVRGTKMPIHWVVEQEHSGNYQISYSPKPGTWIVILAGIKNTAGRFDQPVDTAWNIPDTLTPTTTGRIRVWQASPEAGNNNASDSSNFYTLVSGNLTIQAGTPSIIAPPNLAVNPSYVWNGSALTLRTGFKGTGRLSLYGGNGRLESRFTATAENDGLRFELPGSVRGQGNFLRLQYVNEAGKSVEFTIPSASLR